MKRSKSPCITSSESFLNQNPPTDSADEAKIEGHFWIPGDDERLPGEVSYDGENLRLHVYGGFRATKYRFLGGAEDDATLPLIHGLSIRHQELTLFNCFYLSKTPANAGFALESDVNYCRIHVHAMIVGANTQSLENQKFSRCDFRSQSIDLWLDDRPFEHQFEQDPIQATVKYAMPEKKTFQLPDSAGEFRFEYAMQPNGLPPFNEAWMRQRATAVLHPMVPQSFEWFNRSRARIIRLLSLFVSESIESERIWLYVPESNDPLQLFMNWRRTSVDDVKFHDILATYPILADHLGTYLEKWMREIRSLEYALDLFFSSIETPGHYLETRFLPMVQALEVFSRSQRPECYIPKSDFKAIRKELCSHIPSEIDDGLRNSIESSLAYANEWRLRERLISLMSSMSPGTCSLFCVDPDDFAGGIVRTRNRFTHYSSDNQKVLSGIDLHWATVKLRTMFSISLLLWVGLPESQVREIVRNNHKLARERRQWTSANEAGTKPTSGAGL